MTNSVEDLVDLEDEISAYNEECVPRYEECLKGEIAVGKSSFTHSCATSLPSGPSGLLLANKTTTAPYDTKCNPASHNKRRLLSTKAIGRNPASLQSFWKGRQGGYDQLTSPGGTDNAKTSIQRDSCREERETTCVSSVSGSHESSAPLAETMRPKSLIEFFGQQDVLAPLKTMLESDRFSSFILWGPPGCGKTTLAHIVKERTSNRFVKMSAVTSGVADVRKVVTEAINEKRLLRRCTILFLDEIHRFNKAQQDVLLPHVENGAITLLGATTENPSFEVNSAVLSRCRVFRLQPLSEKDLIKILEKAAKHENIGVGDDVLRVMADRADGDARVALNQFELCCKMSKERVKAAKVPGDAAMPHEETMITRALLDVAFAQKSHLLFDKKGDQYYNLVSALHKSVRGSNKDAAVYYLARMLEAGQDPLSIARRIVRMASEDIGLGDVQALPLCVSAYQACHFTGMPECSTALAQAVCYLCNCPKSNAIELAYMNAKALVLTHPNAPVPLHLCNAPTKLMKDMGYKEGYVYTNQPTVLNPEQQKTVHPTQTYLPKELDGSIIFPQML
eukprot:GHVQ01035704.1.p1 GENE.GHVQ01035704.1~~GHVQ01035704.1.p1  ORF type:complete len:564 (-),score=65.20 GHVQ01035704.1:3148-4839(-)